jgi:2-C-methyl-D-erythritol 2,4-cyclodiphosphate synthase
MGNVDATVIAQSPRLMPYIPRMIENVSRVLGVDAASVSVKATTTEGMGFVGEEKGIAAHAVVLMTRQDP